MAGNIDKRVADSFADIDGDAAVARGHVLDYIHMLRDNMKDRAHAMRRSATFFLAGALLFVLLQADLTNKVSLGPFEFLKGSTLSAYLTSAVAYLFLDAVVKFVELDRMGEVFTSAFRRWNSAADDNNLDVYLMPDLPLYFPLATHTSASSYQTRYDKLYELTLSITLFPSVLIPLAFQVFAFFTLFSSLGASHVAVWVNLGIVVPLLTISYLKLYLYVSED